MWICEKKIVLMGLNLNIYNYYASSFLICMSICEYGKYELFP
jgi:hypothetical protein